MRLPSAIIRGSGTNGKSGPHSPSVSVMHRMSRPILILLALLFLFEAWLWTRLEPIVARVVALIPLARLKARIATAIEGLSPWATLLVFTVPFILLLPLKVLEFWFLARFYWIGAALTLVAAKLLGLGVTAFIFELTKPKLLEMHWFRRFYGWMMWLLGCAHALVDPVNRRVRVGLRMLSPRRAVRALRLFRRIRRRMQENRAAA
jgi:hypothetical protein